MRLGTLAGQHQHAMMAKMDHDDVARQSFVSNFMRDVNTTLHAGLGHLCDPPGTPASLDQVIGQRKRILADSYGQMWSSLRRIGREMHTDVVGPAVERQLPELIDRARRLRDSNRKLGSLSLDPSIRAPRYNTEIEIHIKPGGYHTDLTEDDVFAGAEYERTTYMNSAGALGPIQDGLGRDTARWVKRNYPTLKPKRILEMGCTTGQSTLGWVDEFPDAEVYAIDVGAPVLRYAHARAEALGRRVHFAQQDAEKTRFPDNHFDIVCSHAMIHETSVKAMHSILRETLRILKPGGLMAHNDGTPFRDLDPLGRVVPDWDTHYNAEPFITTLRATDLTKWAVAAGWNAKRVRNGYSHEGPTKGQQINVIGGAGYILIGEK
ncbi:MAG: class I SAM-dependent methyltransferase [Alphaproteobacteria bacterium]|nr:class I SAM-dependent methyltransferase [Alphaproteobacteria bacterium]